MNASADRPRPVSPSVDVRIEAALAPLDAARRGVLCLCVGAARGLVADRDARVAVLGTIALVVALTGAAVAPLWLLVLGPLVLGVPHLLADLRYLALQPGLHRRRGAWLFVGVPLALTWCVPHVWVGLFAPLGAIALIRAPIARRAVAAAAIVLAAFACARAGRIADIAFAHLHNVVAIVLFVSWRSSSNARGERRRGREYVAAAFAAASLAILGGALDPLFVAARAWQAPATGLDLDRLVRALSPVDDPVRGVRWVLFFAFAQSMHYAIWLRLVPEVAREKAGMRPFVGSYRALVRDVGRPLLALCALVTAALVAYAFVDVCAARDGYLRLAVFHGHLELAALAVIVLEGRASVFAKAQRA